MKPSQRPEGISSGRTAFRVQRLVEDAQFLLEMAKENTGHTTDRKTVLLQKYRAKFTQKTKVISFSIKIFSVSQIPVKSDASEL